MRGSMIAAVLIGAAWVPTAASGASVGSVYNFVPFSVECAQSSGFCLEFGVESEYTLSGTITTDGSLGPISTANVVNVAAQFDFVSFGSPSTLLIDDAAPSLSGGTLFATEDTLTVTFEETDGVFGELLFGDDPSQTFDNILAYTEGSVLGALRAAGFAVTEQTQLTDGNAFDFATAPPAVIPLPAPFALLIGGLGALGLAARRKRG